MPLDPCNPCQCISGNMTEKVFWQKILQAVCEITTGGGISVITVPPDTTIIPNDITGFAAITTGYTLTGFGGVDILNINIDNQTDAEIIISADGVNAMVTVPPFSDRPYSFSPGKLTVADFSIKGTTAPTLGQVVLSGVKLAA